MIHVRFARAGSGLLLTCRGKDEWIEPDELEAFLAEAEKALMKYISAEINR